MKITICSSMKNAPMIRDLMDTFMQNKVTANSPDLDFKVPESGMTEDILRKLQTNHFSKIQTSDIIYVLASDRYIGRMVSIEIGYAKALGKIIIFSERTGQIDLDSLADNFLDVEGLLRLQKNKT